MSEMLYTIKTESRKGLLAALDTVEHARYEVILHPTGDLNECTIRSETATGAATAVNDIAPQWSFAVVRVFAAEEAAQGGVA